MARSYSSRESRSMDSWSQVAIREYTSVVLERCSVELGKLKVEKDPPWSRVRTCQLVPKVLGSANMAAAPQAEYPL